MRGPVRVFDPSKLPDAFHQSNIHRAAAQRKQERQQRAKSNHGRTINVAVLGGGISGLTAAYRLAQDQAVKVTLYEKAAHPGGRVQSETVNVPGGDGGNAVFEWGPRSLRGGHRNLRPTIDLIYELGLSESVLQSRKRDSVAQRSYIYLNNRLELAPSSMALVNPFKVLGGQIAPQFLDMAFSVLTDTFRFPRDRNVADESMGAFANRRLGGSRSVDDVFSAMAHGIWAGNIHNLSARALIPRLWFQESMPPLGVLLSTVIAALAPPLAKRLGLYQQKDPQVERYLDAFDPPESFSQAMWQMHAASNIATFTPERGLQELPNRLTKKLSDAPNADIQYNAAVSAIHSPSDGKGLRVDAAGHQSATYDYVISTIPRPALATAISASAGHNTQIPQLLRENAPAVSVMVVNLFYRDPELLDHTGFGYLIPQSVPIDQNPERALGVTFSSQITPGQDTATGTKLGVILGGHWWDDWTESDLPSEREGIKMAKSLLHRHLGITQEPAVAKARLHHNAIPQHTVGHPQRMMKLHKELRNEYGLRLKVMGPWYGGTGVNDCILSAGVLAESAIEGSKDSTGLNFHFKPYVEFPDV